MIYQKHYAAHINFEQTLESQKRLLSFQRGLSGSAVVLRRVRPLSSIRFNNPLV